MHLRQHRMRAGEDSAQVHAEHEVPQLLVCVDEEREAVGARVVDEDRDRPELLDRRGDTGAHRAGVEHVDPDGEPVDLCSDDARAVDIDVGHGDPRAFGRQTARRGGADAARATGHERRPSLQSHRTKHRDHPRGPPPAQTAGSWIGTAPLLDRPHVMWAISTAHKSAPEPGSRGG